MIQEKIIIIPFIVLLLSLALFPMVLPKWWHKNYPKLSVSLAAIVIIYYLFTAEGLPKLAHALEDYFSFIALLFSLFVVSGGIYIKIRGKSTPLRNAALLLAGSVISNIFGTTGASMLLIRPYLDSNKYRIRPYHVVFFIFLVGNIGGSLTPIGDPPLLLGFIKGVPFFWVFEHLFSVWLFTVGLLVVLFFIFDYVNFHRVRPSLQHDIDEEGEKVTVLGLKNMLLLIVIVASVFLQKPLFLREIIMLGAAFVSYRITPKDIHERDHFNFEPIKEVAYLFFAIFVTMIPALAYMSENSKTFGLDHVGSLFWFSGMLTSFLDNAPTYMNFLTGSMSTFGLMTGSPADVIKFSIDYPAFLKAVSVGSVFFGAMTYIGNAPNFMIKSIAEHKGVKMPGFFQYMAGYSVIILLPVFFLVWIIFFK
ncbi:MAG: sodium:proton antiporter [Bacteroidetes bacterium]|nr:sodium:proton antiporter [Bacteroidota bacterium]